MPYSKEEIKELDKVVKKIMGEGELKSITVPTPSGWIVEITEEKYRQLDKGGQNPVNIIINATANATATSSLSLSQNFQNILYDLESSNLESGKLSEARRKLTNLETELKKQSPNENVIKKILRWASNFDLALYLRILTVITELVSKQT